MFLRYYFKIQKIDEYISDLGGSCLTTQLGDLFMFQELQASKQKKQDHLQQTLYVCI